MTNKLKDITKLSQETSKRVVSSGNEWINFMNSAYHHYRYKFNEQLLIYAQRPDATACLPFDKWKDNHRWFNKGTKGIALLENEDGSQNKIRHIFDISDTYDKFGRKVYIWKNQKEYENNIIESLEDNFGELEMKDTLGEAIMNIAMLLVTDNIGEYISDIKKVIDSSKLEELDEKNIEYYFTRMAINSVAYMIMKRCDIETDYYISPYEFDDIKYFNSMPTLSRLGTAICDISEQVLIQISRTVKNLQKNKFFTFDKSKNINYDKDNLNKISEERGDSNGFNISSRGRGNDTRFRDTREQNTNNNNGQIRDSKERILERTQERNVRGTNDDLQLTNSSSRNSRESNNNGTTNNREVSKAGTSDRGTKEERPISLDGTDEQSKDDSSRNSNERVDLQLNLFGESIQLNNEEVEANKNVSTFSFTQEMIDSALLKGSGFKEGKFRIYRQLDESLSSAENITFLKQEYGIGGASSIPNFEGIGIWYDSKGIRLNKGYGDNAPKLDLSWNKVERRMMELIRLNRYFTEKEKQEYDKWLNANSEKQEVNLIEDNRSLEERLLDFEVEHDIFDTSDPEDENKDIPRTIEDIQIDLSSKANIHRYIDYLNGILMAENEEDTELHQGLVKFINELEDLLIEKAEFRKGSTIYLENEMQYIIENIDNNRVELLDYDLYMNSRMPVFRELTFEQFRILYLSQRKNFENNLYSAVPLVNQRYTGELPKEKEPLTNYIKINENIDFQIEDDLLGEGTPKEKVSRNIEAIKLLKRLESENRNATKDEQETLSKYIGWGGLPDVFDERKTNFNEELKELLTKEEYKSAMESTLTAFYTPPIVIKSIYQILQNMGLESANILEPSCRSW